MLKSLRRVFIQFSPLDPRATAARELLQRVGNDTSRKSNPDCVVDYKASTHWYQLHRSREQGLLVH